MRQLALGIMLGKLHLMCYFSEATTVQELVHNLREAAAEFKKIDCSTIAVRSASDLFTLFITQKEHARLEREDFESCRRLMLTRGATFLARLERSHDKIVEVSQPFLASASRVLVHGKSRLLAGALAAASTHNDIEVCDGSQIVRRNLVLMLILMMLSRWF